MSAGGAIGLPTDNPFAWCNNFFDEDFINSDDFMPNWPPALDNVDWAADLDDQSQGGFLDLWTTKIQNEAKLEDHTCMCGICKRDAEARELQRRCPQKIRDVAIRNPELTTRQGQVVLILGNMIDIVLGFLGRFATLAARVAAGASRLAQLVSKGEKFLSIARKGEKITSKGPDDMKDAARKITKNDKLWKSYLRGKAPDVR